MAITMHVDIVSAEKAIYSGRAEMLVASAELGEVGIVPGHAPLLSLLKPGDVTITLPEGKKEIYYVSGGILEVQPYVTTVLADAVERADHIDEAAAEEAKKRAEEAISGKEGLDYTVAAAELARAAAQIRAIRKLKKTLK